MKLFFLVGFFFFFNSALFAQTTATNVTVTDCAGNDHTLFDELDAGKIIVIGWTMPCNSCAVPLKDVHDAALAFEATNPGVVEFWLVDDYANTQCPTIEAWASANAMTNAIFFSSAELDMLDYGSAGMPKVVIVGCTDHKIYYNKNNTPTGAHATAAIQNILDDLAIGCSANVSEESTELSALLECFPNPAENELTIRVNLNTPSELHYSIFSYSGQLVRTFMTSELETTISVSDLDNGMYLLQVSDAKGRVETQKFQIQHQIQH
ncbi:MAG: hypothetical protein A3D92_19350 [Bacteroidetes bacterium RIFCSPHIGHO2_02_FULL_44_7]|nr:MAG: hypothetical protein A3D92_19350 [Bacteroidetes bacterium RIFCSPHIGHO2_02_FULL_44_7]